MNTNEYIKIVLSHIKNKTYLANIELELRDHIADRTEYYEQCGYDSEVSLQKAMEHIGNPDDVGEQMNRLHNDKKSVTAFTIIYIIMLTLWAVFIFLGDSITSLPLSDIGYIFRANLKISLLLFGIIACHSASFSIVSKTRISKPMTSIGWSGLLIPYFIFTNLPTTYRNAELNLSELKNITYESLIYDITISNQVQCLLIIYVVTVLLLSSLVSYFMSCEFKAFEQGRANMKIIYRIEKYKYFLSVALIPPFIYTLLLFIQTLVGSKYGYFC